MSKVQQNALFPHIKLQGTVDSDSVEITYSFWLMMYIHCNFCSNLHIIHGDMKETVSRCFSEHNPKNPFTAC